MGVGASAATRPGGPTFDSHRKHTAAKQAKLLAALMIKFTGTFSNPKWPHVRVRANYYYSPDTGTGVILIIP